MEKNGEKKMRERMKREFQQNAKLLFPSLGGLSSVSGTTWKKEKIKFLTSSPLTAADAISNPRKRMFVIFENIGKRSRKFQTSLKLRVICAVNSEVGFVS